MWKKFISWLAGWLAGLIANGILQSLVWPLILTVITILLAWIQEFQLAYIGFGAVIVFSLTAIALNQSHDWRYKRKVKGKLAFKDMLLIRQPESMNTFFQAFELYNSADFPIRCELISLITSFGTTIPETQDYNNRFNVIGEKGSSSFTSNPITLPALPFGGSVKGRIDVKLKYGRYKNLKYELNFKKNLVVWFDKNGEVQNVACSDAPITTPL